MRYNQSGSKKQDEALQAQIILIPHGNSALAKARAARLRRKYSLLSQRIGSRKMDSRVKPNCHVHQMRIHRDIRQIKQILSGLVDKNETDRWLSAPNAMLGGISPLGKIKQGKTRQVTEVLARLTEGIYV